MGRSPGAYPSPRGEWVGAQPPHAGGPLPRGSAPMGRTWGRGPPLAVGASDRALHRTCRGPFAPRARGVEGSAMADRGEPRKKSCQRPQRGGRVQRPGASLGLDLGTPQRAGFCGGRSPARWAKRSGARPPRFRGRRPADGSTGGETTVETHGGKPRAASVPAGTGVAKPRKRGGRAPQAHRAQ